MPWNCLCSSDKERHILEISAPILNRDGNAKIIQNTSSNGHSKKINFQRNANQAKTLEIVSNNNINEDSKLHVKSSSKQQRQQRSKKNVTNAKDSNAKFQSGEQQSSKSAYATLNIVNKTIDINGNASAASKSSQRHDTEEDDTTYSQLVFERHQINKSNDALLTSNNNGKNRPIAVTSVSNQRQHLNDLDRTGHYDRLPFDKSPSSSPQEPPNHDQPYYYQTNINGNTSTTGGFGILNGIGISGGDDNTNTIPFIDEEDVVSIVEQHKTHLQSNECVKKNCATSIRPMTLNAKNIVSSQTIQRGKMLQRAQLSNVPLRKPRGIELSSKGNEEIASQLTTTSSDKFVNETDVGVHSFVVWNPAKGKVCQVCHTPASSGSNSMVKCRCCELVCHHWCVSRITVSGFCIN